MVEGGPSTPLTLEGTRKEGHGGTRSRCPWETREEKRVVARNWITLRFHLYPSPSLSISISIYLSPSICIHPSPSIHLHLHPSLSISIPSVSIHFHLISISPSIHLSVLSITIPILIPNTNTNTNTWIWFHLVLFVVDLRLARAFHPLRRTTKQPNIPRLTRPRLPRRRTHACGRVEEVGATGWKACWKRREPCSMRPRRVPCHRSKCTPPCGGWRRNEWCIQKHTSPWQGTRVQEGRGGSCSRPAPSKSETKCVAKDVVVARTFHSWRDSSGIQNDA